MTTLTAPVERWQGVGEPSVLPLSLQNEHLTLTFVADGDYGVRLESIVDASVDQVSGVGHEWEMDAIEAGPLWRVVANRVADHGDDMGSDMGGGRADVLPTPEVLVSGTTTPDGDDALCFRWLGVERADGGHIDVTCLVSLAVEAREAAWWIGVTRDTDGDGLDVVEFPRLAVIAPDLPVRTRVLLPTLALAPVGAPNSAIEDWPGEPLETCHPTGVPTVLAQQLQLEALAAVWPGDELGVRPRIFTFAADDRRGWLKRWSRYVILGPDSRYVFTWAHRYVPRWSRVPCLGTGSTSEDGAIFHAPYRVLTGVLHTLNAAWTDAATARYREVLEAGGVEALPRHVDAGRTGLSRGEPLAVARGRIPFEPSVAGKVVVGDVEALRVITERPRAAVMVSDLRPVSGLGVPALPGSDFRRMRGTNWLPGHHTWGYCLQLALQPMVDPTAGRPAAPLDGWFHPRIIDWELDELQRVGFTNVRLRGSFMGWYVDPVKYLASLRYICQALVARGMGITYELWTSTPAGYAAFALGSDSLTMIRDGSAYSPTTLRSRLWEFSDLWQLWSQSGINGAPTAPGKANTTHWPEPLSGVSWSLMGFFHEWTDVVFRTAVRDYVESIARFFHQDEHGATAYHSMDVYNEAGVPGTAFESGSPERAAVLAYVNDFMRQCASMVRAIQPAAQFTGGSNNDIVNLHDRGVLMSYLGAHIYDFNDPMRSPDHAAASNAFFAALPANLAADSAGTLADAPSVPLLVTEFGVYPENSGRMADYIGAIHGIGSGGQVWSFLGTNAWRMLPGRIGPQPFDGIRRCTTGALDITTDMLVPDAGDDAGDDAGPGLAWEVIEPEDDSTIVAWCQT